MPELKPMQAQKKYRIFVDCHVFDGGFQGTRTYIKGLVQELIRTTDHHYFLGATDVENLKKEFGEHANVSFLPYQNSNKLYRLLIDLPLMLYRSKIDYAHFQYRVPPIKVCKYLVTIHDVLFEDYPEYFPKLMRISSYLTYKFSAKRADTVYTVSPFSKEEIHKHFGIPDAKITPNGVDPIFFEDYDRLAVQQTVRETYGWESYFIYISRLEPRKNQDLLLKHFLELELYKQHHLVIIGHQTFKNPKLDEILNQMTEEQKAKVVFLKDVPFVQVVQLLRGSRGFVYPSVCEGFGIPPIEAAIAQVPVLCSNLTAMEDFDFFGDNLFDPRNENEFREKLLRFAQTPIQEEQLAEIKRKAAQKFNFSKAAQVFLEGIR